MNLLAIPQSAVIGISVAAAVIVVAAIVIWFIATYNFFAGTKASVEEAFSTMDVYLKKRYDLVPNLVETVKGYAAHESKVLTEITAARARVGEASTGEEKIAANKQLSAALRSINIVAENYPQLKADSNFTQLQNSLSQIESEIAASRRYYNGVVVSYNKKAVKIPSVIVAKMCGFKKQPYFEVEDETERKNVKVSF